MFMERDRDCSLVHAVVLLISLTTAVVSAREWEPKGSVCLEAIEKLAATNQQSARNAAEFIFAAGYDAVPCLLANTHDVRLFHGECWNLEYTPGYASKQSSEFEEFPVRDANWIYGISEDEARTMMKEIEERRTISISGISLYLVIAILEGDITFSEDCLPVQSSDAKISLALAGLQNQIADSEHDNKRLSLVEALSILETHGIRYRPPHINDSSVYVQDESNGYWVSCYRDDVLGLVNCTLFDEYSGKIQKQRYYSIEPDYAEWEYADVEFDYIDNDNIYTKNGYWLKPASIESIRLLIPASHSSRKKFVDFIGSWGGLDNRKSPLDPWVIREEVSAIYLTRDMSPAAYYEEAAFTSICNQMKGNPAELVSIYYWKDGKSAGLAIKLADALTREMDAYFDKSFLY